MIAVIFEAVPASGRKQHYLDLAATLGTQLSRIDGFVSVERFQSLADPGKMLSLSFFATKRRYASGGTPPRIAHRATQRRGRGGVFADYRLRVAEVVRDYGMFDRAEAPADSRSEEVCAE
jgi:heme-degrading monooxygenase HmoA